MHAIHYQKLKDKSEIQVCFCELQHIIPKVRIIFNCQKSNYCVVGVTCERRQNSS